MTRFRVCLVVCFVAVSSAARAQVSTLPERVDGPFPTPRTHADLDLLTGHFNGGRWSDLQALARTIVEAIASSNPKVTETLDVRRNYVAVMWIGADAFGKRRLMRFVVHDPQPELFSANLPGLREAPGGMLYELLLSRTRFGRVTSSYDSVREQDPIEQTLPAFVQAVAGPLFGAIAAIAPLPRVGPPRPLPPVHATVSRVGLPFKRASVKLKAFASDPWFDDELFRVTTGALANALVFGEVSASACARAYATNLGATLPQAAIASCTSADPDLAACKAAFDTRLAADYASAVAACNAGAPSERDLDALGIVDRRFRELTTASLTNTAELETSFKNRPLTHVAFGAGMGVIVAARLSDPRVKLDTAGRLVADPLSRVMTMAFVNWSPRGYDPDAARMSIHERVRVLVGAALTPDFGIVGGGSVLIARGIGVSAGVGILFAKGAHDDEIGAPPASATDPYRLSVVTAPFVGISYTFR